MPPPLSIAAAVASISLTAALATSTKPAALTSTALATNQAASAVATTITSSALTTALASAAEPITSLDGPLAADLGFAGCSGVPTIGAPVGEEALHAKQARDQTPSYCCCRASPRLRGLFRYCTEDLRWRTPRPGTADEVGPKWARTGPALAHFGPPLGPLCFGSLTVHFDPLR